MTLTGPSVSSYAWGAEVGEVAPPFEVTLSSGRKVDLAALRGKFVYVDFWASWCGPCRETMEWLESLQRRYGRSAVEIVPVSVDSQPDLALQMLQDLGSSLSTAFDPQGTLASRFGVQALPSGFLIDTDGRIIEIVRGADTEGRRRIEERISGRGAKHPTETGSLTIT